MSKNESNILEGEIDEPLCELIKSNNVLDEISKDSYKNIYLHKPVLQVEASGFQVLPGLLDTFLYALNTLSPPVRRMKKIKLFHSFFYVII